MKIDLRKIPAVYMNLEHHVEKNNNMMEILTKFGFENIKRIDGVLDSENPTAGCSKAHHKALSSFKAPFVLFEDDCMLMEEDINPIVELPENSDALYLGISTWGRMNGHEGECVQYNEFEEHPNLLRIYNMLGGHAIVYLNDTYREVCERISYHAGYVIKDFQDIGFAEIQRYFNVYCLNNPIFYQTSNLWTKRSLTSYPMSEYMQYNPVHFKSYKIR